MSNAAITIRTSDNDKKAIDRFARSVGMSTSAFATVVLLQAVREQKIVLTPSTNPSDELTATMQEVEADIKAGGHGISKAYDDVDEFFADLESETRHANKKA